MEKSQQELKRTRLQNRRFKNLAEIAVVYDRISGLIREYDDGFRSKAKQIFTKKKTKVHYPIVSVITFILLHT